MVVVSRCALTGINSLFGAATPCYSAEICKNEFNCANYRKDQELRVRPSLQHCSAVSSLLSRRHFSASMVLTTPFGSLRGRLDFRTSFGFRLSAFGFSSHLLSAALLLICPRPALAADTLAPSNRVLHAPPAPVPGRLASFHPAPGFKIQLVATEPMVSSPVAIAFDENGRLFVAEMRDYPNRGNASPHLGRVRVLTDPDFEGVYQNSTV